MAPEVPPIACPTVDAIPRAVAEESLSGKLAVAAAATASAPSLRVLPQSPSPTLQPSLVLRHW